MHVSCGCRMGCWRLAASDGTNISGFGTSTSPARMSAVVNTIVVGVVQFEILKYDCHLC
jgi:hypothetical protein